MSEAAVRTSLPIEYPEEEVYSISDLGEGLSLKNRRTVELTPSFASSFLEQYAEFRVGDSKVDRPLDEGHVIHLAREMVGKTFLWEQVTLVLGELEGREYRLNGQHTCWAVLYADEQGLPKETRRPVQLHRYSCQSMEDMRRLYASLDAAKPRSQHDKIAALLSGSDAFPGYKRGHLAHLAQGLALWLWPSGTTRGLHRASERAYLLLKDYHKVALVAGSIMRESKPTDYRHLKRAAVMGAMLATCEKAPQIAVEFWRTIRDGLGLVDKEDPRLVLRNWLLTASLVGSEGVVGNAKVVGQEEMYRACIHAWNAYRTNRRIKQIRVALNEERPQPK